MADPYQEALNTLVSLGAERALVLQGPAPLKPRLMHGFDGNSPWSDQISLHILEQSMQGEPLLLGDVTNSELGSRWSVEVSGVRSVVCVPFWSPSSRILGLLYADTRAKSSAFTRATMSAVQNCARHLERALYGGPLPPEVVDTPVRARRAAAPAPVGRKLNLKQAQASPRPASARIATGSGRRSRPAGLSLSVFVRSLATMIGAGLGVSRALNILADHEEDPALRDACGQISASLQSGSTLSAAMARHPQIFQRFDCSLVEVGERSGNLCLVLGELASFREAMLRARMRLQSALVYPAFLASLSLLAVLLAPPLVLRGQIEMLRQNGQQLPWLSQLLVSSSDVLCSGWGLSLLLAGSVATALVLRQRPDWRQRFWHLPLLSRLRIHAGCSRFARGLSLTYRVGIPITQCLTLATRLADLPELERDSPQCLQAMQDGQSLATVLSLAEVLPASFPALVRAGEESGKLDVLLEWIARFYEAEFEENLERLLSILQPLLIGVMGILVGLLLLATLLPMVNLVQQL